MIIIGLAFLITWLQVELLDVALVRSFLITALIFIILGVFLGERPFK